MDNDIIQQEKEELERQHEALLQDIDILKETLRGEVDMDVEEADPDVVEREKSIAILAAMEERLASIKDALRAIERGTYGVCERCGKEIPIERLQVKPDATLCVTCQAEVDRLRKRGQYVPRNRWD